MFTARHVPAAALLGSFLWGVGGLSDDMGLHASEAAAVHPSRVVHRFDFHEQDEGNVDEIPMHWVPIRPTGFPTFATGRLDRNVGHDLPPSLYLNSEGRSVAFAYLGDGATIQPRSEYQIEAYLRPDRLQHARACLAAQFLDSKRQPLLDTMARSPFLAANQTNDSWIRVELLLPAAPPEAVYLVVSAWILDEHHWNERAQTPRFIAQRDLMGGAWFDDIVIRAVPRVELSSSRRENVLSAPGRQDLHVFLADQIHGILTGELSVCNVEDDVVLSEKIRVTTPTKSPEPRRIPVDALPPGLYTATLNVETDEGHRLHRSLTFARLDLAMAQETHPASAFGVVLMPDQRTVPAVEAELLRTLGVGAVKVPIWSPSPASARDSAGRRSTDRELRSLAERGVRLTAVLAGVPAALSSPEGPAAVTLSQLLEEPPELWRPYLAEAAGADPQLFAAWQISADYAVDIAVTQPSSSGIDRLRAELERLVGSPTLTTPLAALADTQDNRSPVERVTAVLSRDTRADEIGHQMDRLRSAGHDRPSAFVQALDSDEFRRDSRLADFIQRVVSARHAGAETVYVPQPWNVRQTHREQIVEPTEEFLILRTLARYLRDAVPGEVLPIAPGVKCLPFYKGESALVVVWDTQAPPSGRTHVTQLGRADRQINLDGSSSKLERDAHGQHRLHLTAMPVIIDEVDRWLLTFRNSVRLEPQHVEAGLEVVPHDLVLKHAGPFPLGGQVQLSPPSTWQLTPAVSRFTLAPDQESKLDLSIRYPPGEPAGRKSILAKFSLMNDAYVLEVPLTVEIGLTDVEVEGAAVLDGDHLLLRHTVTNRSQAPLDFRSSAQVPGQERQYRPINNLLPGETQVVEYRFSGASGLSGSNVRLGLRPLADGRRMHNLELRVR